MTTTTTMNGDGSTKHSNFELPVVDFTPFLTTTASHHKNDNDKDITEAQRKAAQAVDEVCRSHGFVCLRNTGITKEALKCAFAASKALFGESDEAKSKLKPLDPATNTGYNGMGSGEALNRRRGADLKEVFNIRNPQKATLEDEQNGLFNGTSSEFQQVATDFWADITRLSQRFSKCCALALGLELDYFTRTLQEYDQATCRMLHYPPLPDVEASDQADARSAIRVGEHTDFGIFTFLFIDNMHDKSSLGLQVKSVEGGDLGQGSLVERDDEMFTTGWKDVVFDPHFLATMDEDPYCSVLVNTGALMARWTNDVWRATAHRVVVTPEARNSHRYSIACFFDPDKHTICSVDPKFVADGEEPKYPPITSGEYLLMKLQEAQGSGNKEGPKKDKEEEKKESSTQA